MGRSGNNRRNRRNFSSRRDEAQKHEKKHTDNSYNDGNQQERLSWTAPVLPADPITTAACSWCKKQITDITTAIADKDSGLPVHFDCVVARIAEMETLDANDGVCYIGGGRFGIVHYNNPPDTRDFTIKKIYEWEVKENNNEWRKPFSEYFSIT